jgi:biopolymer transport protein ExbD
MLDRAFDELEADAARAEISITPLIDMVFILLIFFVVTTTFTKETGITVDRAKAATAQAIEKNVLVVAVDRAGAYWYDGRKRKRAELVTEIRHEYDSRPELNIVIVPDRKGVVDPLIILLDRLRAEGISRISLGTRRGSEAAYTPAD